MRRSEQPSPLTSPPRPRTCRRSAVPRSSTSRNEAPPRLGRGGSPCQRIRPRHRLPRGAPSRQGTALRQAPRRQPSGAHGTTACRPAPRRSRHNPRRRRPRCRTRSGRELCSPTNRYREMPSRSAETTAGSRGGWLPMPEPLPSRRELASSRSVRPRHRLHRAPLWIGAR